MLLLGVLLLELFISIWNTRVVSSISSVSLPEELYLDGRIYNIPSKVRDGYVDKEKRDRNKIP